MTDFEKALRERVEVAKREGAEDIRSKIVKSLESEFLDLVPSYILPGAKVEPLTARVIWLEFAGYRCTARCYELNFANKRVLFAGYEDVEKFTEEVKALFPSDNIDCHIIKNLDWDKTHNLGYRAFGLEFSLDINALAEKC